MDLFALGVAAMSAVGFAVSTSLQHHANAELDDDLGTTGIVLTLARRPWWVLGQGVGLVSFALHAWALRLGLLVLVQPVVVSGIVLAVPVRGALARRLPRWSELGTVTLTAAGLTLFLLAAQPRSSQAAAGNVGLCVTAVGALVAVAAARWAGRRSGVPEATGYGLASGVLFGLTAGLVKLAAADAGSGQGLGGHLAAVATAWPTWAVPVVGLAGVALNQRAYRAAPLSASMPLLNIVDVLVAIAFGVLVFGEVPAHDPVALAGQAVAIVLMAMGLRSLARQSAADPVDPAGDAGSPVPSRSCS